MTELCVFCSRTTRPVYKDEMCRDHYDYWILHGTPIPTRAEENEFKGHGIIDCNGCGTPLRDHPVGPMCRTVA